MADPRIRPHYADDEPAQAKQGGLMTDLDDLAKQAMQVQDRLDLLVARLQPILVDQPFPAEIADREPDVTVAQGRVRAVADTLQGIDARLGFVLDGIRL
jgi:hypothetical protein